MSRFLLFVLLLIYCPLPNISVPAIHQIVVSSNICDDDLNQNETKTIRDRLEDLHKELDSNTKRLRVFTTKMVEAQDEQWAKVLENMKIINQRLDNQDNMLAEFKEQVLKGQEELRNLVLETKAKDIAKIPDEEVQCNKWQSVWLYDTEGGHCVRNYRNECGDDENSFLTEEACLQYSEKLSAQEEEPAPAPAAADTPEPPAQESAPATLAQECDEPMDAGDSYTGAVYSARWFYDASIGTCRHFPYSGYGGNDNRFDTEDDCKSRCVASAIPEPAPAQEPAPPAEPASAPVPEPAPASAHELAPAPLAQECDEPMHRGDCDDFSAHWFYDGSISACRQFDYSGCGGNDNRFDTEDDCKIRCMASAVPAAAPEPALEPLPQECKEPMDNGDCEGDTVLWFYDGSISACRQFHYTNCGGNDNRFDTEDDCKSRCVPSAVLDNSYPTVVEQLYYHDCIRNCIKVYGPQYDDFPQRRCLRACRSTPPAPGFSCGLPVELGAIYCDDYSINWYFDVTLGKCSDFLFTGCQGLDNRFESEEECNSQCGNFTGIDCIQEPYLCWLLTTDDYNYKHDARATSKEFE